MKDTRAPRLVAFGIVLLSGCTKPRDLSPCASFGGEPTDCAQGTGFHPDGWADATSPSFHQTWLRANGDRLSSCQSCHGKDYRGGAVGVACTSAGCHTQKNGPEFCGTCHGGPSGPLPSTGAHALHAAFCSDCHDVPKTFGQSDHITGTPRVAFAGLAAAGSKAPTWDATTKTCSNVYCHAARTPTWQPPAQPVACDACHGAPPASHAAWARAATPTPGASPSAVASVCSACHPVPTPGAMPAAGDTHVNGEVDFAPTIACDACHGHDASGAPGPALDGSEGPSSRGVGQHQVHLLETLPNRIGHVVACATCHAVPASVTSPGHLDHPLPATVSLPQDGTYDASTQTCTVWCHSFPNNPAAVAPVWHDTSGAVVAPTCTGCHGFPPATLRDGTPHTQAPSVLSACTKCHPYDSTTHVDGLVELVP